MYFLTQINCAVNRTIHPSDPEIWTSYDLKKLFCVQSYDDNFDLISEKKIPKSTFFTVPFLSSNKNFWSKSNTKSDPFNSSQLVKKHPLLINLLNFFWHYVIIGLEKCKFLFVLTSWSFSGNSISVSNLGLGGIVGSVSKKGVRF